MNLDPIHGFLLLLLGCIFFLGLASFVAGLVILVSRVMGRGVLQTLTTQTTRLAQKGLAEDVAGLVGNASALLNTVNQMANTATGIGLYLTIIGALMMIATVLSTVYLFR
jgi:hypothetical protein